MRTRSCRGGVGAIRVEPGLGTTPFMTRESKEKCC